MNNKEYFQKTLDYISELKDNWVSGACSIHQRDITLAVKRARQIAVLPYTAE